MIKHDTDRIDQFTSKMQRAFPDDQAQEARDAAMEVRSHLLERAAEGRLDETLAEIGNPEDYARSFHRGSGDKERRSIFRHVIIPGVIISAAFFLTIPLLIGLLMELTSPQETGLWVHTENSDFYFGHYFGDDPNMEDRLGAGFLPLVGLSIIALLALAFWQARALIKSVTD